MPVSGAALGFARHFTDRRIDVYGHRPGAGTRTRGPGAAQRHTQGLVQLANVTLGERTQERSQRGRGHHLKGRATPDSSPRLVAPARRRSAWSMCEPPTSIDATNVATLRPALNPPGHQAQRRVLQRFQTKAGHQRRVYQPTTVGHQRLVIENLPDPGRNPYLSRLLSQIRGTFRLYPPPTHKTPHRLIQASAHH